MGTIAIKCEVNDGHKYIDKAIVNGASKIVAEHGNYSVETKIVDDTRVYLNKKLTKYLSKYEVEIVSVTGGQACLERIRKNEKYDLIIMEDELDKLSSIDTLNKLKQIENFKIPVIILTRKIELNIKKDYSRLGFTDTYIIPVNKKGIGEIVHKYVLDKDLDDN